MLIRRALLLLLLAVPMLARGQPRPFITVASTTSTEESGLFGHILPRFLAQTGIEVRVVAVGTGQALAIGARGDADALLVHDRAGEDKFVADGNGVDRRDVMFNDFVLVGPKSDPAHIAGGHDAVAALQAVAAAHAPFASRGDDSGTDRMERRLWNTAGIDAPATLGPMYRELGQGMGPTLNTAAAMDAYTLTDRASWANFKNRQNLVILTERDRALFNPYGSILVNPARFPHVKTELARVWHAWLTSGPGRTAIESYRIGNEQLFFVPGPAPPS